MAGLATTDRQDLTCIGTVSRFLSSRRGHIAAYGGLAMGRRPMAFADEFGSVPKLGGQV